MKLEKRFAAGGTFLGAYTFSKLMTNAEYLTSWLDSTTTAGFQDTNNLQGEYSLSSFDSRQRLVASYVYELPIGKGTDVSFQPVRYRQCGRRRLGSERSNHFPGRLSIGLYQCDE